MVTDIKKFHIAWNGTNGKELYEKHIQTAEQRGYAKGQANLIEKLEKADICEECWNEVQRASESAGKKAGEKR